MTTNPEHPHRRNPKREMLARKQARTRIEWSPVVRREERISGLQFRNEFMRMALACGFTGDEARAWWMRAQMSSASAKDYQRWLSHKNRKQWRLGKWV